MVKSLSFKKTLLRKYLTTLKTFLLCAFSCVFQENLFVKKLFPHWWLSMVFSSVCVFVSVKKTCLGKLLPHWSCLNGFSPLSIFWCISRKHFWEKKLIPHLSYLNDFCLVSVFWCYWREPIWKNFYQNDQIYMAFFQCVFPSVFQESCFEKNF